MDEFYACLEEHVSQCRAYVRSSDVFIDQAVVDETVAKLLSSTGCLAYPLRAWSALQIVQCATETDARDVVDFSESVFLRWAGAAFECDHYHGVTMCNSRAPLGTRVVGTHVVVCRSLLVVPLIEIMHRAVASRRGVSLGPMDAQPVPSACALDCTAMPAFEQPRKVQGGVPPPMSQAESMGGGCFLVKLLPQAKSLHSPQSQELVECEMCMRAYPDAVFRGRKKKGDVCTHPATGRLTCSECISLLGTPPVDALFKQSNGGAAWTGRMALDVPLMSIAVWKFTLEEATASKDEARAAKIEACMHKERRLVDVITRSRTN